MKWILLIFLVSCSQKGTYEDLRPLARHSHDLAILKDKQSLYLDLIKGVQDEHGFIEFDQCDSLLFTSLSVVGGVSADLFSARDPKSHKWFRTPYKDCFANELGDVSHSRRSASTISKDMLTGLLWSFYHSGERTGLEELYQYGKQHNWKMGDGPTSRTYFSFNLQHTLYKLTERTYKGPPDFWTDPVSDHQRHIVALHIILRGFMHNGLDNHKLAILETMMYSDEDNPLFQFGYHLFTDGDQSKVLEIMNNEQYFPSNDIPSTQNRCSRWLMERNQEHRVPCPDSQRQHSGGDFLFMYALLEKAKVL